MCGTGTSGLCKDQSVKVPQSQKWCDTFSEEKDFSRSKIHFWQNEPSKLNIASQGLLDPQLLREHRLPAP